MKRLNIIKQLIIMIIFSAITTGCEQPDFNEQTYDGEYVEYSVNLDCIAMSTGTATTKAADAEQATEFDVKNLWYIQFENNKVIGQPTYITNYNSGQTIKLVPIDDKNKNKVMFIANSFYSHLPVYGGMSYDEVTMLKQTITKHSDCYYTDEADNKYVQMCGVVDFNGTTLPTVPLYATVSKIELNVTLNEELECEIKGVEMGGVCNALYFYCDPDESDDFPTKGDFQSISFERVENTNNGKFTFYVPVNRRGINTLSDEKTKPQYATSNSTFATLFLENKAGEQLSYKFVLGANLGNDFNLSANTFYKYDIDYKTLGDPDTDLRVGSAGGMDYTDYPSANCYILNPNISTESIYKIPVTERVNKFWTYYESEVNNRLTSSEQWDCDIIWSDAESLENSANETISFSQDSENLGAMKIVIPAGFNHGNFLVGVKKAGETASDKYLWSWHFWITDYNPNEFARYENLVDMPMYGVSNGEIQKFSEDNYYFLDRNIGARAVEKSESDRGELLYQFGRKDPILSSDMAYNQDENCKVHSYETAGNTSMAISVNNPALFYTANTSSEEDKYDWQNSVNDDNKYKNKSFNWNDKEVTDFNKKSIFDPSPLGWRVPGLYVLYKDPYITRNPTNSYGVFSVTKRGLYVNKYNEGDASTSNYNIYFPCPAVRYLSYDKGIRSTTHNQILKMWVNQPYNTTSIPSGYGYQIMSHTQSDYVDQYSYLYPGGYYRASGAVIRPMFYPDDLVKR